MTQLSVWVWGQPVRQLEVILVLVLVLPMALALALALYLSWKLSGTSWIHRW
jgi:hypothetical protein